MQKNMLLLIVVALYTYSGIAQTATKEIKLTDIWQDYTFFGKTVPGFNFQKDGKHYTRKETTKIKQYDLTSGAMTKILFDASTLPKSEYFDGTFDDYSFSDDEKQLLIKTGTEAIYRRSTRANFFVYNKKKESFTLLDEDGKQRYATFSPDGKKVAYVRRNNLYYKDLKSGKITQITKDGAFNEIINGSGDWVYEEEFYLSQAFEWSADSKKIGFIRFDESQVKEFIMTMHLDQPYPEYVKFKYPKVGEANSMVSVHIYHLDDGKTVKVDTGKETDQYIPRIKWTQDANSLSLIRLNRHQNHLELLIADATSGQTKTLLEEKSKYYFKIKDDLTFLKNGKQFVWTSENSGYNHVYLYNMNGTLVRQLTKGDYEISKFYGVDEKKGMIYYQAAEVSPLDREVYEKTLIGGKKRKLTTATGTNKAQFSDTYDYFVNTHSSANTPNTYTVYDRSGKRIRVVEDNADLVTKHQDYGTQVVEFFDFKTSEEVTLNGYMIKPPNFDSSKKYPVLMYVYGGPGSQTAANKYGGSNYWWFQMMAQKGYVIVSVDNRGTGGRGEEFKKMTYLQLGKYETRDQIEAAQYLASLPYIDGSRIGIFGWSYGGYMSSLCILKGNDVFKTAIAVAPVTNWKWYDTVYTERFMRTSEENEAGYQENSPVYFADQLKGNYLLVHGNGDDNVHFQNTAEMANALINANKQFDTYFYPNRNHSIFGGNTRLHLYTKMTNFLLEKL